MEYEKCYVFAPDEKRQVKRRKTEQDGGLQSSWHLRKKAYQTSWRAQQKQMASRLDTIHSATVTEIAEFLDESTRSPPVDKIPTALVLAGANSARTCSIASQLSAGGSRARRCFIALSSATGTNLRHVLKTIIQKATSCEADETDQVEDRATSKRGAKLLHYDLQILGDYVEERQLQQLVIAFEDTEAFDGDLLSELIELLACWQDRIPFAILFTLATSVEFLQQSLSRDAVKCLDGTLFDATASTDEVEQVLDSLTEPSAAVWLGPDLVTSVLARQSDYIQGLQSLQDAAQYAWMAHHYANALSLFLTPGLTYAAVPSDHFEAVRTLPSFRDCANKMLEQGETKRLRALLDQDEALFALTMQSIAEGRSKVASALAAAEVVRKVQQHLPYTQVSSKSTLYVQATSGKLAGSPLLRSLLLSVKKLSSDTALKLMSEVQHAKIPESVSVDITMVKGELAALAEAATTNRQQPLRSEDDLPNSTLRTTVVAHKVALSKQKASLSQHDAAYTTLVRRFADILDAYFAQALVNPKDLVMHEIFLYDLRSPHRDVFTPKPRHALERALASPHDYLDCPCCAPPGRPDTADAAAATTTTTTLADTQPPTAILYQLYLESATLINASDLWHAFHAVMCGGRAEEEEEEEEPQPQPQPPPQQQQHKQHPPTALALALFQRALAELKYLGLVKATRKKVDHIAKVAWRGL